jgi:hypothetical protein
MRKRTIILALAIVLVASVAWAGGGQKGQMAPMTAAERAAKLQAKLGLSAEQTEKVKAVYEEFDPRFNTLRTRMQAGEDVSAEKKQLKEEQNARLKTILTPEQWAKYEAMKSEQHKPKR